MIESDLTKSVLIIVIPIEADALLTRTKQILTMVLYSICVYSWVVQYIIYYVLCNPWGLTEMEPVFTFAHAG